MGSVICCYFQDIRHVLCGLKEPYHLPEEIVRDSGKNRLYFFVRQFVSILACFLRIRQDRFRQRFFYVS